MRLVQEPEEITAAALRLRERVQLRPLSPQAAIAVLEQWGAALEGKELDSIPGLPFLRLWLRHGTLAPIVLRELGPGALEDEWREARGARLRA
ncbi:MAG: hypothetical protein JOZ92_10370, partial [Candidatus Dormibacteraeota bacterium]|nr:hypothetical protein [Candidatus Dormibacteraeota bacterium]